MKVKWRLLSRDLETGKGQFVWADQSSKKQAIKLAEAFNNLNHGVRWEVYRQVGNEKVRVY